VSQATIPEDQPLRTAVAFSQKLLDDSPFAGGIMAMAWLVSVFIMAISLAGCMERTGAPSMSIEPVPPQTAEQLTTLVKPQLDAWSDCSLTAASKYFSADESATTIARAAMVACRSQERDFENALTAYNRTRVIPPETVARMRNSFVEKLSQMIIDRRQNIKLAKASWEEWTHCVVDAAEELAKRELPLKEAVLQSYRVCGVQEDAVRRQLANLTSDAAAEVERRKIRVAPIVGKFVEEVRSGGADRPKKPDMTI